MRILLADDHEVVRRGVRALLEAQGGWSICAEAGDGLSAVALAVEKRPDLAVLDLSMPGLDGLEATRRIRSLSPSTRVLLLTVHDLEAMGDQARGAGAHGCVLKSDAAAALVAAVRDLVARDQHRLRQPRSAAHGATQLTPRERQVVRLVAEGRGNIAIAAHLGISVRTVETHRAKAMQKLQVDSLVELVHYAVRHRLVAP